MDKRREKGRGCYGAVYEVGLHGVPCIAKWLHNILVGRGQEEPVSEEDRRAAISWFCEERVLPAVPGRPFDHAERHAETRKTKKSSRDQKDQETKGNLALEIREVSRYQRDQRNQTAKFNVWGQITSAKTSWQSTPRNQTQELLRSRNSRSRKCTVIWLDELTSFLQHQLLKGSNCSNAHMHLGY